MAATEAMGFGTAVHKGLEAHFRGEDGELSFRKTWRHLTEELNQQGTRVDSGLSKIGLVLIEKVLSLGLVGEPERKIWMRTDDMLGAPTLGYADLWCPDSGTIVDFKTTVGTWSAERAEKEVWQPCLYSYAFWLEYDQLPKFEYIVLNRVTGGLQRFETCRTDSQIDAAFQRAHDIAECLRLERFECRCKGASCPECGHLWTHQHVCELGTRIRLKTA